MENAPPSSAYTEVERLCVAPLSVSLWPVTDVLGVTATSVAVKMSTSSTVTLKAPACALLMVAAIMVSDCEVMLSVEPCGRVKLAAVNSPRPEPMMLML